jgi:hypothetical protein
MSEPEIDPQLIRDWVYAAIRKPYSPGMAELEGVLLSVYNQACQQGYFQPRMMAPRIPASPDLTDVPASLQNAIRGVIWDLIIQGIIVPGVPNQFGGSGLPAFVVTPWGKECLEHREFLTFDAGKYIERLRIAVPTIDASIVLYLTDALASFRVGAYLSSAVMTGVASERTLLLLRDGIETALSTPDRKKKFADGTKGISISRMYHEIWKRLEPVQNDLSQALGREDIKVELSGIFDLIRKTRNEAGHPTGRQITRDEADSMLHLYPVYCKTVYATIGWLKSNSL